MSDLREIDELKNRLGADAIVITFDIANTIMITAEWDGICTSQIYPTDDIEWTENLILEDFEDHALQMQETCKGLRS